MENDFERKMEDHGFQMNEAFEWKMEDDGNTRTKAMEAPGSGYQ